VHYLELNNVSSGYNGQAVLHDSSFKLQEPSVYVVLGPNGAGKTTLFRTIAGILEPYSGKILLDDQNITTSEVQLTELMGGKLVRKNDTVTGLSLWNI
jgi:ABC-type cobalamin/Fe3+-siderophores transport system ATPase subunit